MRVSSRLAAIPTLTLVLIAWLGFASATDARDDIRGRLRAVSLRYCSSSQGSARLEVMTRVTLRNDGEEVGVVRGAQGILAYTASYTGVDGLIGTLPYQMTLLIPPTQLEYVVDKKAIVRLKKNESYAFTTGIILNASGTFRDPSSAEGRQFSIPDNFEVVIRPTITTSVLSDAEREVAMRVYPKLRLLEHLVEAEPLRLVVRRPTKVPAC